jgi:hypothetical protein
MSSNDQHLQTRGGARRRDKTPSGVVAVLASFLVGIGGCSAGSNGGPDVSATGGNPPPPNGTTPSIGAVLVSVKVQDAHGAPVPGAEIKLLRTDGTGVSETAHFADQDGRAEIVTDTRTYGALVSAPDMAGAVYQSIRQAADRLEITVTLHPTSARSELPGGAQVITFPEDIVECGLGVRLLVSRIDRRLLI